MPHKGHSTRYYVEGLGAYYPAIITTVIDPQHVDVCWIDTNDDDPDTMQHLKENASWYNNAAHGQPEGGGG